MKFTINIVIYLLIVILILFALYRYTNFFNLFKIETMTNAELNNSELNNSEISYNELNIPVQYEYKGYYYLQRYINILKSITNNNDMNSVLTDINMKYYNNMLTIPIDIMNYESNENYMKRLQLENINSNIFAPIEIVTIINNFNMSLLYYYKNNKPYLNTTSYYNTDTATSTPNTAHNNYLNSVKTTIDFYKNKLYLSSIN